MRSISNLPLRQLRSRICIPAFSRWIAAKVSPQRPRSVAFISCWFESEEPLQRTNFATWFSEEAFWFAVVVWSPFWPAFSKPIGKDLLQMNGTFHWATIGRRIPLLMCRCGERVLLAKRLTWLCRMHRPMTCLSVFRRKSIFIRVYLPFRSSMRALANVLLQIGGCMPDGTTWNTN